MYIGSGDCSALLAGKDTASHLKLLQRFVSDEMPYYNAENSPIDALRTGAILEDRYLLNLPNDYYAQYKITCREHDVLKSTIDFAKIQNGNIVDFDELKTCNFNDFIKFEEFKNSSPSQYIPFIKKAYKNNYNQVQFQLLCSELTEANLVFLVVYDYNDDENRTRDIKENEYIKFRIQRDESVISLIEERAQIFQTIKNYYNGGL